MFGISTYLNENIEDVNKYFERLSKFNINTVFTSMHINEEDSDTVLSMMESISRIAKNKKIDLMIDISSNTLSKFNMTLDEMIEYYHNLGVNTLRVDFGITINDIKKLSENFNIVLNASTIDDDYCNELIKFGINLEGLTVCHNFYPRPDTGLGENLFRNKNKYFKEKGFKIQAFIPGDKVLRGPIYEGLPTLEKHRKSNLLCAYIELVKEFDVDEIIVGDTEISDYYANAINEYINSNRINLRLKEYNLDPISKKVFWNIHKNRKDYSERVIRVSETRLAIKEKIPRLNTVNRPKGTVTIDNENYKRYNGELQIALIDLDSDDRVNVLGYIEDEDICLLKYITEEIEFRFI